MTIYRKDSGIWKPSIIPSVKVSGVWTPLKVGYVKDAGIWKPFYVSNPTLTWASSAVTGTDGTSHSFATQAIGTAASNRYVIVVISTGQDVGATYTNGHPSTVTIGGVSATKLYAPVPTAGDGDGIMSMWGALVPTGTTATIAMTWPVSQRRVGIATYALYYHTMVPTYVGSGTFATTANISLNVLCPRNGKGLIGNTGGDASSGAYPTTWSGTTPVTGFYDQVIENSSNQAGGTFTVSGQVVGTNSYDADQFCLWASWGTPFPSYRYLRWTITETLTTSSTICQVSEFHADNNFFQTVTTATTTQAAWTGSAGESPDKIWDNIQTSGNKWCDTGHGARGGISQLIIDMGSSQPIQSYSYCTANDEVGRDPTAWTLEGSNDNTNWTLMDTRSGYTPPAGRNTWTAPLVLT